MAQICSNLWPATSKWYLSDFILCNCFETEWELPFNVFKTKIWLLSQKKGAVLNAKLEKKLFKYMLHSNGPRTDPLGTPWRNSFQELSGVFILVPCQRFAK